MSRKRRARGESADDLLGELQSNDVTEADTSNLTASDFANVGYATAVGHDDPIAKLGRNREKILRKPIEEIYPNPTQPRRAIPNSVRQYWNGEPDSQSMAHFFEMWLQEMLLERGEQAYPLDDYLAGMPTERSRQVEEQDEKTLQQIGSLAHSGPNQAAFMRIVELAASIRRDGLTNPISVAEKGRYYEIETGERRWLAYHLLNWRIGEFDDEKYDRIPCRVVDGVNIWRQASENNARADLNAIGKARQFALLLMDLLRTEKDVKFKAFDYFQHEQEFYAQVADGNTYRIPHGTGEALLNATGLENAVQLRQYRALLRLPQTVWEWADDLNWTESFIRKELLAKSKNETDLVRIALQQALAEGYSVSSVTEYEHLLEKEKKPKRPKSKYTYTQFVDNLAPKIYQCIHKMPNKDQQKTIAYLRELLVQLETE